MKKIIYFCVALTALVSSVAFCEDNVTNESMILFSDSRYDVSKLYHSVSIMGFVVGSNKQTYSIVKINEFPGGKVSYKLFITNGNKSKDIELLEIEGLEYLTLGKIGFNDKGKLTIPFLAGNANKNIHLYEVNCTPSLGQFY
jgi:Ca2+-binding RTX toxin-like protein